MDNAPVLRDQLEARLRELEQDYAVGERRLRQLDLEQAHLRETLLRLSGAMQVLRELLDPDAVDSVSAATHETDVARERDT
jgi:predicted nuclease with TOPRIM domain